nr:restriction endonuclease subunit S [Citrobacter sp. JL978]
MGKVTDIAEIISGFAFKSEWFGAGDAKVIRIGDLKNGRIDLSEAMVFDEKVHKVREQYRVKSGDILMALSGATVGKIAVADLEAEGAYLNQRVAVIRGKCYENTEFLKYIFTGSRLQKLLLNAGGAAQPNLSPKDLAEMEIPLPPLTEQKRIATILNKADNICQKREQAIKLADNFLRATFLEMFGDPVENPKGWKVKPLISVIVGELQNGAYFPKDKYSKEGVEMVHMADAFYDVIQRGSLKRVQASDADIVKYSLTHEDLMISRRSLNYEGAAKPSLIPQSDEPLIFESSMIRITPDKKQIDKLFLFYYLTDPLVKEHFIRKFVTGATIKGINQKNLEQVRIIVPPLELQKKFSYIVHTLEKHKKKINESEILSIELFTAISQRAFLDQL